MSIINIFTIRKSVTKEIIYSEGILDCDSGADFRLESKWITAKDKNSQDFYLDYRVDVDCYSFSGDVDMLCKMNLENIYFSVEKYHFDSLFSLEYSG